MQTSLTVEKVRKLIDCTYQDETFLLDGQTVVLYLDAGSVQVSTAQPYTFDNWETFLDAPVFFGQRLNEVVDRLIYTP